MANTDQYGNFERNPITEMHHKSLRELEALYLSYGRRANELYRSALAWLAVTAMVLPVSFIGWYGVIATSFFYGACATALYAARPSLLRHWAFWVAVSSLLAATVLFVPVFAYPEIVFLSLSLVGSFYLLLYNEPINNIMADLGAIRREIEAREKGHASAWSAS